MVLRAMRIFIAIPLKEELKDKVLQVQDRLDFSGSDIKFVEKENLHFSIKFLGEASQEQVEKIKFLLQAVCNNFECFDINIAGIGAFPSRSYARVVWLGVKEGSQQLSALMEATDLPIAELGFDKEKSYVPHLTLGRVRSGCNKHELLTLLREMETEEIGKMKVEELKLYESLLQRAGPVYKELFSVRLAEKA